MKLQITLGTIAQVILLAGVCFAQSQPTAQRPAQELPPVIGEMPASEAIKRLEAFGDRKAARKIRRALSRRNANATLAEVLRDKVDPWKCTSHVFGFVQTTGAAGLVNIVDARTITPDITLQGANIRITLDALRTFDYPGDGIHQILFTFHGQHQAGEQVEALDFSQKYEATEGGDVGIASITVFKGLKVTSEGVGFKGYTVNLANKDDKKILDFLGSDVFKQGMQLINTINPLVPIVSKFATGITEAFAKRNDNIPVQNFDMGLDFSNIPTRVKLKEGAYIAVQVCDIASWDWSQWAYNVNNGTVVVKATPTKGVPNNYVVFSISKIQQ